MRRTVDRRVRGKGDATPGPEDRTSQRAGDLAVTAVGMVSPVGADAVQTFTSVRAGLRRMREQPALYRCLPENPRLDAPEPLVASAVYHLDTRARREGRAAEWIAYLAGLAFQDLERRARLSRAEGARLGVFLALPEREGLGPAQRDELVYHFHNHAERDLAELHLAFGGHAAALGLAETAAVMIRDRRIGLAAVGGADSWLFRRWLEPLDRDWRLLSGRNPDGFLPGEAAAFFLLEPGAEAARRGAAPLATVRAMASARIAAGPADAGATLAGAVERVLPAGARPVVVCDLNGESRRTKEWAFAVARLGRRLEGGHTLQHPASSLGDVGAASGAAIVALAAQGLAAGHDAAREAVVWAASDEGERRALLLERA